MSSFYSHGMRRHIDGDHNGIICLDLREQGRSELERSKVNMGQPNSYSGNQINGNTSKLLCSDAFGFLKFRTFFSTVLSL